MVTARVQRQVAGLFVAEERGSHELKGVPEPVTLFRIVRASGATHAEFRAALKVGKEAADQRVERSLYQRAVGYHYDAVKILRRWNGLPRS